jgi:hypothetical protein
MTFPITDLTTLGISLDDATALRRISMTLHRWHELECGDSNDYCSTALVRGRKNGKEFTYDEAGSPFFETHYHHGDAKAKYHATPDRERGALKRLARIMARYPGFASYVQGDPRGCALYILRPGDVPTGKEADAYYSRGVAVYK